MIKHFCVSYDEVSGQYSEPVLANNEKEAVRNFGSAVRNMPQYLRNDVSLYAIGTIHMEPGVYVFDAYPQPRRLATGHDFASPVSEEVTDNA